MTQATLNVIDYYISNDFCRGGNGEDERQLLEERRLVAAAPDLLAVLEGAYKHFLQHMERDWFDDDDQDAMQKMFDAIARVKGLDQ